MKKTGNKKFTPGPYLFDDVKHAFRRPAIVAKGAERYSSYGPICLVMKRHKNYVANGRLLEKAPDMYGMLVNLEEFLRTLAALANLPFNLEQKAREIKRLLDTINRD